MIQFQKGKCSNKNIDHIYYPVQNSTQNESRTSMQYQILLCDRKENRGFTGIHAQNRTV